MTNPDKPAKDLLSLTKASIPELIDALRDERTPSAEEGGLPSRSLQIAELIAAETVRLVRLGNRAELTEARLELARVVAQEETALLAKRQPKVHRLLIGSSTALAFATAPSSSGGELTVLRSWNGMAAEVVALVDDAPEKALRRAELREQLGVDESHLSHLLADLEAANLITRRRKGREVIVHLGRAGRSRHVGEFLRGVGGGSESTDSEVLQKLVRDAFRRVIERAGQPAVEPECPALQPLEREAAELNRELTLMHHEVSSVEKGWITCRINVWGTHAEGDETGRLDDRYLFWAAQVENGNIVNAKSLAPTDRWFQAIQPGHGQPSELAIWLAPAETERLSDFRSFDSWNPAPPSADKGNWEKPSYSMLLTLDERNGEERYRGAQTPLADLPRLTAATER